MNDPDVKRRVAEVLAFIEADAARVTELSHMNYGDNLKYTITLVIDARLMRDVLSRRGKSWANRRFREVMSTTPFPPRPFFGPNNLPRYGGKLHENLIQTVAGRVLPDEWEGTRYNKWDASLTDEEIEGPQHHV